jgi:hypothetical protein
MSTKPIVVPTPLPNRFEISLNKIMTITIFTIGIKQSTAHQIGFSAMIDQMKNWTSGMHAKIPTCPALVAVFHMPAQTMN